MLAWLCLLGQREEPPGGFPNRTANRPTQRVLPSAQVQVNLGTRFEHVKQVVFRVDSLLVAREIGTPATCVHFCATSS
jgi:hypothetical protein